jgi:hypothetical protein
LQPFFKKMNAYWLFHLVRKLIRIQIIIHILKN